MRLIAAPITGEVEIRCSADSPAVPGSGDGEGKSREGKSSPSGQDRSCNGEIGDCGGIHGEAKCGVDGGVDGNIDGGAERTGGGYGWSNGVCGEASREAPSEIRGHSDAIEILSGGGDGGGIHGTDGEIGGRCEYGGVARVSDSSGNGGSAHTRDSNCECASG